MARPVLWFEYIGKEGTNNTLSYNEPYNTGTIRFSCDKAFNKFMCRCTKDGEPYGREIGFLVQEFNGERPPATILDFTINAVTAMTEGDGLYRISLYVQDMDGQWNDGQYFLVNGGGYFLVGTDHDKVVVKEEA